MELKNVGLSFAVQRNSTKGARVMINRKGFGHKVIRDFTEEAITTGNQKLFVLLVLCYACCLL